MDPLLPSDPKKLGVWTVTARLGKGGMGAVYMAHNKDRRTAAIKVISGADIRDEKVRDRFKQEIQALSLITTPPPPPLRRRPVLASTLGVLCPLVAPTFSTPTP